MFIDFPLGHTAGKRGDRPLQRRILIDTLSALDSIQEPGTIRKLPYRWSASDDWKRAVAPADDRQARSGEPQYQYPEDREAAAAEPGPRG